MVMRRASFEELNHGTGRKISPVERRIERARIHKVSVWPPAWMAGPMHTPSRAAVSTAPSNLDDGVADVRIVRAVVVSAIPPSAILRDRTARHGRVPKRWSEALLALGLGIFVLGFSLATVSTHAWQRTEVARLPQALSNNGPTGGSEAEQVRQRTSVLPGRPQPRQRTETEPLWPTPPAHRATPVEPEEPTLPSRRMTSDPATRALQFRPDPR